MNVFILCAYKYAYTFRSGRDLKQTDQMGGEYKFRTNPQTQGSTRNGRKGEMDQRVNTINESVGRNR